MDIKSRDVVLCEFYFSDAKEFKKRPVLVLKDNLPHDDFLGIAISSQIRKLFDDELIIDATDFESGTIPLTSKIMLRKTFVISKQVVIKKYGTIKQASFSKLHQHLCQYLDC